jgi:hypothetical protein
VKQGRERETGTGTVFSVAFCRLAVVKGDGVVKPGRRYFSVSRSLVGRVSRVQSLPDWLSLRVRPSGRELRADKRWPIPGHLAPIVERLGLKRSTWAETVRGFGRRFKQAAG